MRLLLDRIPISGGRRTTGLPRRVVEAIREPTCQVLVSAVVVWEMSLKARIGTWPEALAALADLLIALQHARFQPLPISLAHARRAGEIVSPRKDPFDRLLAAQAEIEEAAPVTIDPAFRAMGIEVFW